MFRKFAVGRICICSCSLALILCAPLDGASARTFAVLYSFMGKKTGSDPNSGPIADDTGNFYGTTELGGTAQAGTVYKLATDGTETVLYSFCRGDACADGSGPEGGLIMDGNGNLYGTAAFGGPAGDGVIFELAPSGVETPLYAFAGGSDGNQPEGGVIRDGAGMLYGTTIFGGGNGCGGYGCGTVFRLAPDGTETILHAFAAGSDGAWPYSRLVADRDGNLYGTASYGGAQDYGVVFEVAANETENVLYSFSGGGDGGTPLAGLYRDEAGNLYGTTVTGGVHNDGTVFRLAPDGTETVLHSFKKGRDGGFPNSPLIADGKGNLYGTTTRGGGNNAGIIFRISADGSEQVLHAFLGGSDGKRPVGALVRESGNIYGATLLGGAHNHGEVFQLLK
jgi:uncharacterized repeat protein (TIGR03803 family)